MTILELYQIFNGIRNTPVTNFIEAEVMANASDSVSQIIGNLLARNSYDILIHLSGKVLALNIRDLLGIRNITSTKPITVAKIIPTLNPKSSIM